MLLTCNCSYMYMHTLVRLQQIVIAAALYEIACNVGMLVETITDNSLLQLNCTMC